VVKGNQLFIRVDSERTPCEYMLRSFGTVPEPPVRHFRKVLIPFLMFQEQHLVPVTEEPIELFRQPFSDIPLGAF